MTPGDYYKTHSYVNNFSLSYDGSLEEWTAKYVRPVINIKADVLFEGKGTAKDPYVIAS